MKRVLTGIRSHRAESFVEEETVIGARIVRRSERKSTECSHYTQTRFETEAFSDPPTDSEIDPCEGQISEIPRTIPRLRGDRTERRDV